MIYLDNAATTQVHQKVLDEMLPYLKEEYGNPGSVHSLGRRAEAAVETARERVAQFFNARPDQIIFTSGGSEGNNMVLSGSMKDMLYKRDKAHVVISSVEHDSVYNTAVHMFGTHGKGDIKSAFHLHVLGVDKYGKVSVDELESLLKSDSNIGLVSIMYANNETGAINPVKDICEVCHKYGALFHTDCVQAAGCNYIDVEDIDCDFATISGHKIYAPKGIGALYVKNPKDMLPLIYGGNTQEFGLRGGTENVANIVGIGKACEMIRKDFMGIESAVFPLLQAVFYDKLMSEAKELNIENLVHINNSENRNGKVLNVRFDGVDSETLVLMMDARGVCISSGSACHGHESEPSRVLIASGLTAEEASESVRISFSLFNTIDEVTVAASRLCSCVKTLINIQ